jgi:hypothetical protein
VWEMNTGRVLIIYPAGSEGQYFCLAIQQK